MESSANSKRVVVVVWRNRDLVGEQKLNVTTASRRRSRFVSIQRSQFLPTCQRLGLVLEARQKRRSAASCPWARLRPLWEIAS